MSKIRQIIKEEVSKILKENSLSVKDYDEFVRPDYVEITLSNGKKIKISRKTAKGGHRTYQLILHGLDEYKTNPRAKQFIDKIVSDILKNLGE